MVSTSDAERPGRPKEVTSQEMIDQIHDIVLNDCRLKVREISDTVNISVGRVWHILHECLGMRKLCARWVPHLLTADHKRARVVASEQCLGMFQRNSKDFLRRYVTADKMWIHYYTPDIKKMVETVDWAWRICAEKKRRRYHQTVRSWPQIFGTHIV